MPEDEKATGGAPAPTPTVPNWADAWGHCLAGGLAGVISNALIFPIDVAKTRMQVEMPIIPEGLRGLALLRSFYSGLPLGALETGCVHASSFLFYDWLKGLWIRRTLGRGLLPGEETPKVPLATHMLLGIIASLGTQHVTLPLKVILIRIQGGNAAGFVEAARKVYAESGPLGFWAGARGTYYMATNPAVTYVIYERVARWFSDRNIAAAQARGEPAGDAAARGRGIKESAATPAQQVFAGFVAKAFATLYSFPVQKTQAMVQGSDQYSGQWQAITDIARRNGV